MTLRDLHRISAVLVGAFACVHIVNHLVGLAGVEAHIEFMRAARSVYRLPIIESLIVLAVAFQICSGLILLIRRWKLRRTFMPWLQAASGAYLAFFLLNHVGSVFFIRNVLHLDTNLYIAVAGFQVPPFQFFFAPYYFFAVLALFTHLGCALHSRLPPPSGARILAVALPSGFVVALLIVLSLAGTFHPVHVPSEYKATYGWHP